MQVSYTLVLAFLTLTQCTPIENSLPSGELHEIKLVAANQDGKLLSDKKVAAQDDGAFILLCTEANFRGCDLYNVKSGWCCEYLQLASHYACFSLLTSIVYVSDFYNDRITSLSTDHNCQFWVNKHCKGDSFTMPAGDSLNVGKAWNDKISSFLCW
ncbi:hypothetical protein VTL71DRAFT_1209 [Oculimacula yallundae]|uniref:Uncharacterized protein n=1 Tax=Oculimacula yallundae TaxID=86028 RepID=A0ABR4CA37_9HELO